MKMNMKLSLIEMMTCNPPSWAPKVANRPRGCIRVPLDCSRSCGNAETIRDQQFDQNLLQYPVDHPQGGAPQTLCLFAYNPINYGYIYHESKREIGVIDQLKAISNGGITVQKTESKKSIWYVSVWDRDAFTELSSISVEKERVDLC